MMNRWSRRRLLQTSAALLIAAPLMGAEPLGALLFDGKGLGAWKETDFAGHGEVRVEEGQIILEMGEFLTGVTYTKPVPKTNYELTLEAMKVDGNDFFCGLTFPIGDDPCSLILGGWGGGVVGLSSLDGFDASENDTSSGHVFAKKKWYRVRLRVSGRTVEAWLDDERIVKVDTTDRKVSIRGEVELSRPLGIATYQTTAAIRNIRLRSW